jgi:glutathione S-transferase
MADAMFAPVCTRFITYGVDLPSPAAAYVETILARPELVEWIAAAEAEPDGLAGLEPVDVEF